MADVGWPGIVRAENTLSIEVPGNTVPPTVRLALYTPDTPYEPSVMRASRHSCALPPAAVQCATTVCWPARSMRIAIGSSTLEAMLHAPYAAMLCVPCV